MLYHICPFCSPSSNISCSAGMLGMNPLSLYKKKKCIYFPLFWKVVSAGGELEIHKSFSFNTFNMEVNCLVSKEKYNIFFFIY